jgi:hypothetical protein
MFTVYAGNKIRVDGAKHLSEALKVNGTLQQLNLDSMYLP